MCSAAYGNFYILSSWRSGVFSSCCLALDSSSSFPCPAFRAIAKSIPQAPTIPASPHPRVWALYPIQKT
ncbi:hypothetical protein STEG23_035694, partial [Scotinomys teguina]